MIVLRRSATIPALWRVLRRSHRYNRFFAHAAVGGAVEFAGMDTDEAVMVSSLG
jgi:hypothetical protein